MPNPIPTQPYDPAYQSLLGGVTPGYTGPGAGALPPGMTALPPPTQPFQGGNGGLIPPMAMPNYIPSQNYLPGQAGMSGFMPPAIGGYWNQMAQQMAGPMYMPPLPSSNIPSPIRPPAPPQTFTPGPGAAIPNGAVPGALNPVAPGMPSQLSRLAGGGGPVGAPSGARTIQAFGSAPYIGSATTWGIDGTAPASPFMGSGGHPIGYFDGTFGTQVA